MERSEISRRASEVFHADAVATPRMTLRGGYAEDSYDFAPPLDPVLDELTGNRGSVPGFLRTISDWNYWEQTLITCL